MAELFDKNDIKVGEYHGGGILLRVQRDGRDIFYVYDMLTDAYVERECRTVEVELTTD